MMIERAEISDGLPERSQKTVRVEPFDLAQGGRNVRDSSTLDRSPGQALAPRTCAQGERSWVSSACGEGI